MNVFDGELPERLAAEYVLGTMGGGARRRFEALLPAHPSLGRAVAAWEGHLLPMALRVAPVAPAADTWAGIERRLGWTPAPRVAGAGRLRFWQAFSALATAAAIVVAVATHRPVAEAPMIVVLHATQGSEALVAGLSADRRQLSIQPLQKVALTPDRSLELWALRKDGPPASLGVIAADRLTAVSKKALPSDAKGLAVSLEPAGGSPTGAPTGRVLFVGDLTL